MQLKLIFARASNGVIVRPIAVTNCQKLAVSGSINPAVSAASSMSDEILVSLPITTVGFLPVPSCKEMAAACPMR